MLSAISSSFKYLPAAGLIALKNERLPVTHAAFYIADVTDARAGRPVIGYLALPMADGKQPEALKIELKDGVPGIKNFIEYGMPINKTLHPVVISIKNLRITEAPLNGGRVNGQITLSVSFGWQQGEDIVHLTDYTGNTGYQRAAGPAQQIEPLLRSTITNSLVYLNNWMNAQADHYIKLAKGVKVIFNDYTEPVEGDTIYYQANRPLKWTDFQQKPQQGSRHGAEIFASIGYNEAVEVIKGIINIRLDVKVYAPKSACWVRGDINDLYSLNHEQRHFDIVKLVAEHFKQNILTQRLNTLNYDGPINVAYFDALRELDKLQKAYDNETQHSINTYQQILWNKKIDQELQKLGIKLNNA